MAHPLKARIINTPQTACFLIVLFLSLSGLACLDTKPNCANLMPQYFADFFASRFAAERFSGTTCCRIRTSKSHTVPSGLCADDSVASYRDLRSVRDAL